MKISKGAVSCIVVMLILLLDQSSKIWVKTHMMIGDYFKITEWFYIYFTENNGMAFGWEFVDKAILSIFRVVASAAIIWYISKVVRDKSYSYGFVISLSLILAGALGNIIDSLCYGVLFSQSYGEVAQFLPEAGGYAPVLYGRVVDMLYFPLIHNQAGEPIFFRPIFNIADSAISVGVAIILLFQRKYLSDNKANVPTVQDAQ